MTDSFATNRNKHQSSCVPSSQRYELATSSDGRLICDINRPVHPDSLIIRAKPESLTLCLPMRTLYDAIGRGELQALVYDFLPPTTGIVDNAIGLEKLSANEQFFDEAQTATHKTIQIISDVCFINDHVAYASRNKTKIV